MCICMLITQRNKPPLCTSLYDNSDHALNCTAKRPFSFTSEMKEKNDGSRNEGERAKHAVDIEKPRRAKLTKKNDGSRNEGERAKHAVDIEKLRRAKLTKRNDGSRNEGERAKHAVDIEKLRRAKITKRNEKKREVRREKIAAEM